jgi:LmbE family N-acetylglucosaminyl deacetylase
MDSTRRLMAVLAHPDDESLGFGGTLAKYAAEGIETSLVCATRGERGWTGEPAAYPGPRALGRLREAELLAAARALGIADVTLLDYLDGDLRRAAPREAVARIVREIRRVRPDVVVTFGPDGAYGHPDHVAISQLTTTAIACAADPTFDDGGRAEPHRVAKLYYRIWTAAEQALYEPVFGRVTMDVDGQPRGDVVWPDWTVTTRLDTTAHWSAVRAAVSCHRSQIAGVAALTTLPPEGHRALWGTQDFYRVMSAVDADHGIEDDLFAGLGSGNARPDDGAAPAGVGSGRHPTTTEPARP